MLARNFCKFSNNVKNLRNISRTQLLYKKIYTDSDEWYLHTNFSTHIGITKNAREQLGEIVYIEYFFEHGNLIKKGDKILLVESIKANSVIESPFDCKLIKNNNNIIETPDEFNSNVEDYWLIKVMKNQ